MSTWYIESGAENVRSFCGFSCSKPMSTLTVSPNHLTYRPIVVMLTCRRKTHPLVLVEQSRYIRGLRRLLPCISWCCCITRHLVIQYGNVGTVFTLLLREQRMFPLSPGYIKQQVLRMSLLALHCSSLHITLLSRILDCLLSVGCGTLAS